MIDISIKINTKDIQCALAAQMDSVVNKAAVRAINKTAMQARTESVRAVRTAGYNIKASAVRNSFKLQRATKNNLTAVLTSTGKPIALIDYGARQVGSGVSVAVKNGRKIINHAFIAKMRSGHKGVFVRIGKSHRTVVRNGKRVRTGLPVKELFGPSVPTALANEKVQNAVKRLIKEKLPKIFAHELRFASMEKKK
ncbi:phage tail protein [Paludibacterium yongneupense]|uniref:phage tail protein n=1 Tax=Paludibacterium yongneupense TaxID=400061 RepID=UPI000491F18D|nr:phage tail protein [Paludibacterium yongneupense]